MRKSLVFILTVVMMMSVVGCGGKEEDKDNKTTTENSIESTSDVEENLSLDVDEEATSEEETTVESAEDTSSVENTTVAEQETTTKVAQSEKITTTKKPAETTKKPVETTTKKPVETTTKKPVQKPTETTVSKPVETEAPIVTKIGSVDNTQYNKAVKAFEGIVKKMRQDGIVKKSDVCVTMEGTTIKVDINYADKDSDLTLKYNADSKVYELVVDYGFQWADGFGTKINGKDSATYNRDLVKSVLSMITSEKDVVFDRIDSDCYSCNALDNDKWSWSGDCFIKGGQFKLEQLFSYYITKEKVEGRDKSYTLVGKNSEGNTVECIIDYNSNVVTFEPDNNGAYMEGNDENNIYGYPALKTGSSSYINYKTTILNSYKEKGDPNVHIEEVASYRVNGYTYNWCEVFYETADAKGDPEVLYVQIGANEYLELYGFESWISLEEFVDGALFIREVNVK